MKMAVIHMRGDAGDSVVQALAERGLGVSVISSDHDRSGERRTSAVAAVSDDAVPLIYEIIERHGGTVVTQANPFLSLVDAAEYHVGSPVPSSEGGVSVFLLRLRRYERIR